MRLLLGTIFTMLLVSSAAADAKINVTIPHAGIDEAERAVHIERIKRELAGIAARTIDVTVSKLGVVIGETNVEVRAEIKVVLSKDDQMTSVASGNARYSIAKRSYRPARLGGMRKQVLADALDGLSRRIRTAL